MSQIFNEEFPSRMKKKETLLELLRVWTKWRKLWKFPKYWDFWSKSLWTLTFHEFFLILIRWLTLIRNSSKISAIFCNIFLRFRRRGGFCVPSNSQGYLIWDNIYAMYIDISHSSLKQTKMRKQENIPTRKGEITSLFQL